jgi:hypothetical protein
MKAWAGWERIPYFDRITGYAEAILTSEFSDPKCSARSALARRSVHLDP